MCLFFSPHTTHLAIAAAVDVAIILWLFSFEGVLNLN
eukprot:COSAG02_NODE_25563_length_655_cov_0.667266_2_plen_36_part_01